VGESNWETQSHEREGKVAKDRNDAGRANKIPAEIRVVNYSRRCEIFFMATTGTGRKLNEGEERGKREQHQRERKEKESCETDDTEGTIGGIGKFLSKEYFKKPSRTYGRHQGMSTGICTFKRDIARRQEKGKSWVNSLGATLFKKFGKPRGYQKGERKGHRGRTPAHHSINLKGSRT